MLANSQLQLPIVIRLGHSEDSSISHKFATTVADVLFGNLQDLNVHAKLRLNFVVDTVSIGSVADLWTEDPATFDLDYSRNLALNFVLVGDIALVHSTLMLFGFHLQVPVEHWGAKAGEMYFGSTDRTYVMVSGEDVEKVSKLLERAIHDVVLDIGQLKTVVRRDMKQRMTNWELMTMSERDQQRCT